MSNFLAIATVTETLRQILDAAVQVDVSGASATAVRPAGGANGLPDVGVNAYLFQVTPNPSLRNLDLPSRDSDGRLVQRPRAALDLHYLLSCYGAEGQLEPQRVLGSVVSLLHSQPVLTPTRIRQVIDDAVASDPQSYLGSSNLDQEIETVKFSMMPLTLDELSRMWSVFFQTEYTLSVVYVGTAVLIERQESARSGLPVRARNVYALPFRQPVIEQVTATDGEPITVTSTLQVEGKRLQGDITRLRFTDLDGDVTPAAVSDGTITAPVPAALRAGVVGVQVVQLLQLGTPPSEHRGFESNVFAFVLRPTVNSITPSGLTGTLVDGATLVDGNLILTFDPPIRKGQRVVLLLNEFQAPLATTPAQAYSFGPVDWAQLGLPPATTEVTSLDFAISGVVAGDYLVRLQVDGAESLLAVDAGTGQFNAPQVAVMA